jgi:hypothetical protein
MMNPSNILSISLILFTQLFVQTVSAENNTNPIAVVEKSLQTDTIVTAAPPTTHQNTPVLDKSDAVKPLNSSAPVTSVPITDPTTAADTQVNSNSSNWDAAKQNTDEAWKQTKETSAKVWDVTKDGSKKVWEKTKEASSSAWKATKSGIHKGANYISDKTKD